MSDEHKTDDAHDTHSAHDSHETHDAGHHDAPHAVADDAHPVEAAADHDGEHGHDDHAAPEDHATAEATHNDHAAHDDHTTDSAHDAPAEVAHDDHAAPVAHVDEHAAHDHEASADAAHESHDAPAAHDEPHAGHGHDAAAEASDHEPVAHHDETPAHGLTEAAVAAAGVAAAVASTKPPVWSDDGDAPFEEPEPAPAAKATKPARKDSSGGNEFVEIVKTIVFALLIALVLRVFLFQPFTIPSASMQPNLYEGDYIVVTKWSYGYSKHSIPGSPDLFKGRILEQAPQRGDIVVFKLPSDNKTDYIKRVIGLPGDKIQMINNRLYLNGTIVPDVVLGQTEEADAYGPRPVSRLSETLPGDKTFTINDFGPGFPLDNTELFTVPAGHYFMMGDNRDNSVDSREHPERGGVGLVPAENLIGKAQIILFSWSPGASLWDPVSWFTKLRPSRFFTVLH